MKTTPTSIPEVLLIEPQVARDGRGLFLETFQVDRYREAGVQGPFVQDNFSRSSKAVLRGLHYQYPGGQGKLVQVLEGEVFDVAVDIRWGSPTFGRWVGARLSGENNHQLWIPEGFAHGFCVIGDQALLSYKCTAYYDSANEHTIRWDDPEIGIDWPVPSSEVNLSIKDQAGVFLAQIEPAKLPAHRPDPSGISLCSGPVAL